MCPIVPTFTCGLVREKTSLAIVPPQFQSCQEPNRRTKFQIPRIKTKVLEFGFLEFGSSSKSCCWGLNPGPRPYQGRALPLSYSSLSAQLNRSRRLQPAEVPHPNGCGYQSDTSKRATGLEPATSSLEGWSSTY